MVASHEWRAWYKGTQLQQIKPLKAGELSAHLNGQDLVVNYTEEGDYELNIAYLGIGLVTKVTAGENSSRTLVHDFVVLKHFKQTGTSHCQLSMTKVRSRLRQVFW